MTNLSVPYISQFDPQANQDPSDNCGPSCVSMILNFYGESTTANQIFTLTGAVKGQPISIAQLQQAIGSFGYKYEYQTGVSTDAIRSFTDRGIPPIALVHAGDLTSRQDQGFSGGHFLVVDGYRDDGYFVNDPDFWGQYRADGDHHFYTKDDFEKAWSDNTQDQNPNNSLLIIYPKTQSNPNPPATGLPVNYANIVHGSTQWDATCQGQQLGDPTQTDYPKLASVIAGYKSRVTDLGNQLTTSQTNETNALDQVSRLKGQLTSEQQLRASLTGQVNQDGKKIQSITTLYEGQLASKQAVIDSMGKDKGQLNQTIATLTQQLQTCKASAGSSLTRKEAFILFVSKLFGK